MQMKEIEGKLRHQSAQQHSNDHPRVTMHHPPQLGMWRSQPISASVGCGFHVQNPSDSDADSESVTSLSAIQRT